MQVLGKGENKAGKRKSQKMAAGPDFPFSSAFCAVFIDIGCSVMVFPHRVFIKSEVVRAVAGLGVFKHNAVAVVGLAADNGHAVIVFRVQMQVFFVDFRYLFHRHYPFAVDDGHVQFIFQIVIDGVLCNLLR